MAKISENDIVKLVQPLADANSNPVGMTDDCACLPFDERNTLLVSTDNLLEGVHFNHEISPRELGHKALAVNLSDIAAMGGQPKYATLSWALPTKITQTWVKQFLSGWEKLAKRYNVSLVGGDTTRSEQNIFINVTAMGIVPTHQIKKRSAAKVGDVVMVSGPIGDSRAGLELVMNGQEVTNN